MKSEVMSPSAGCTQPLAGKAGSWASDPRSQATSAACRSPSPSLRLTTPLSLLQEGFAPPEDDEIEEHQQEDQDEY